MVSAALPEAVSVEIGAHRPLVDRLLGCDLRDAAPVGASLDEGCLMKAVSENKPVDRLDAATRNLVPPKASHDRRFGTTNVGGDLPHRLLLLLVTAPQESLSQDLTERVGDAGAVTLPQRNLMPS